MSMDLLFSLVNLSVMPAWLLLIFAPNSKITQGLVHSMIYPAFMGVIYIAGLISTLFFGMGAEGTGFSSITQVRQIFASDMGLIVGWAHFLAFDLFVGAWVARNAKLRNVRHALVIPCLLLTFMFGPVGLVLYLIIRHFFGQNSITPQTV